MLIQIINKYSRENIMRTSLVIMAAGIGSRYGASIKQLESVGKSGEIIMDYSVHDAINAGFNKIIFIIREDIKEDFMEVIGNRIEKICSKNNVEVAYAYQDLNDLPEGVSLPDGRKKPWGTGQAVLSCRDIINEPFAVINADDYYGKESFVNIHEFLISNSSKEKSYCMSGFILKNTLSENGGVTRGICSVDENDYLTDVEETYNIVKTKEGAETEGRKIDVNSYVSMNMWGFTPEYIDILEDGFKEFFDKLAEDKALSAEYLIPIHIGGLLEDGKISVKLLETHDKWFGITYREDLDAVIKSFDELIEEGVYSKDLFEDMR